MLLRRRPRACCDDAAAPPSRIPAHQVLVHRRLLTSERCRASADADAAGVRSANGRQPKLLEINCPRCGAGLAEGAKIAGRRHPGHHDVSICKACAEILVLSESERGIALRPTTASEYLSLPEEAQDLLRVAYSLVRRQRPPRPSRPLN